MIEFQGEEFSKIDNWKKENNDNIELQKQNYYDQDKTFNFTIQKLQIVN
jgi:hypothetical protein